MRVGDSRLFVSKTLQCVCVCVVYKRMPFLFVSQSFEVKTLPCVSAVMELLFVSTTLQYVCVVGKGILFPFLVQSFEGKTLPCVSAVRELLCGQSVRPFLCRWKARLFSLLTWKDSVCVCVCVCGRLESMHKS